MTGAGACDSSRKLLVVVEAFGILIHATRTFRETLTPAPSQRTRFAPTCLSEEADEAHLRGIRSPGQQSHLHLEEAAEGE